MTGFTQEKETVSSPVEFVVSEGGIEIWTLAEDGAKNKLGMIKIDGPVKQILRDGLLLYIARGVNGLTIMDISDLSSPEEIATFEQGRDVMGIEKMGDTVLVIISTYELAAIDVSNPKNPKQASALAVLGKTIESIPQVEKEKVPALQPEIEKSIQAAEPAAEKDREIKLLTGKVKDVKAGWVILDIGSRDGVKKDMHFKVLSKKLVKKPDLAAGGITKMPSGEKTAILVIEQVTESQSGVYLGRGESARPDDIVVLTDEDPRISLMAPKGQFGFTRIQAVLRPFFGVGRLSFGMINDLLISHQFKIPMRVGAYIFPLGFAANGEGTGFPTSIMGIATYSSSYFEIGMGLGGSFSLTQTKAALTINQFIRMGSLEGFHVVASTSFMLKKTDSKGDRDEEWGYEVSFGQAGGEINIPLHRRITLSFAGGGGSNGWGFGTIGIKTYIRGNGGKGTIIVPSALGYATVFDENCDYSYGNDKCEGIYTGGPTFSIGVDYRF